MTFLWIVLAIVYIACWIYFGLSTFRKGHYWLFWIGFFIPILWIVGAFICADRARGGSRQRGLTRPDRPQPVNDRVRRRGASAANSAASL